MSTPPSRWPWLSPPHSLTAAWILCLCALLYALPSPVASISYSDVRGKPYRVDYDYRSLRINGERVLLQSAGIHYPRSSPSMWPQLMASAAAAHLNTVQTYVFHNYHESLKGEWDWSTEHRNLTRFLQAAADAGLFVNLRIEPYICGEWFYGGQPLWMHGTGIAFRQYNTGWTNYMRDMDEDCCQTHRTLPCPERGVRDRRAQAQRLTRARPPTSLALAVCSRCLHTLTGRSSLRRSRTRCVRFAIGASLAPTAGSSADECF
jgi:hypothetical protein